MSGDRERPRPPAAEDRLVRDMLSHGGHRVWITTDWDMWRDDMEFISARRLAWDKGVQEDMEHLRKERLRCEQRALTHGRLLWIAIPAFFALATTMMGAIILAWLKVSH